MLQTVQSVPNLEEKTSVESFLKKYMEEKKGFKQLCPGHPAADAMIECFLEQLKLDFNMNLMVYLKKEEMKQCLEIFNTKRAAKDETEVTMEEMTELYEKEENRMKLFENPGINFADIYGVLHFARILQSGYDDYEDELPVGDNLPIMLIHDLLSYAENFTSEYA
uniref:MRG domain-containing protein n=1 Tax=Panagrolaimus davidi TaxID=227884 RepID=A0A914Q192_9BILA